MKIDVSAKAITTRLRRVSQLRRLCLSLSKAKPSAIRNYRTFRLIVGYLPEVDFLDDVPARARQSDLRFRFAVALDTFRPDSDGMYFDADLALALISAMSECISCDRVEFVLDRRQPHIVGSFENLLRYYESKVDPVPFDEAAFYRDGRLACSVHTEPYDAVGGPWPYSDTVTFSFYSDGDCSKCFTEACTKIARDLNAQIGGVFQGSATPPKKTLQQKVIRFFS